VKTLAGNGIIGISPTRESNTSEITSTCRRRLYPLHCEKDKPLSALLSHLVLAVIGVIEVIGVIGVIEVIGVIVPSIAGDPKALKNLAALLANSHLTFAVDMKEVVVAMVEEEDSEERVVTLVNRVQVVVIMVNRVQVVVIMVNRAQVVVIMVNRAQVVVILVLGPNHVVRSVDEAVDEAVAFDPFRN